MLFLAALFFALAVLLSIVEFFKPGAVANLLALVMGFVSAGLMCWVLWSMHTLGKI